jgi:2-polyprenyl-3-methyl-5-hydroxy-6-metoxy-1,4-benzoquinol methylase
MAKENNQKYSEVFVVDNAYTSELYDDKYNTVVVLEVLEHIENDLLLLERIRKGSTVIFSIPNFNSESHMRWFDSTSDILKRYENFLAFESIHEFNSSPYKNKIYLVKSVKK